MSPDLERFDAEWLALREPADAVARAQSLLGLLRSHLAHQPARGSAASVPVTPHPVAAPPPPRLEVLDLGSGTGSTVRWLSPLLGGPQRWTLLDHDADLLARAIERCAGCRDAAGAPIELTSRTADLADLTTADLAGTDVVTASALLDLLTRAEVGGLVDLCAETGCAALLTLSVAGRVALHPPDPYDAAVAEAFDAHQRRRVRGEALLGPDAVDAAASAFQARGYAVRVAASPWRLGPGSTPLVGAWLDGWLSAAEEQEPALAAELAGYRDRRAADIVAGRLEVEVDHRDLLALPDH